jgi:putative two-component system response regulator
MRKKCLLIVDDLEIDRTVLKNILCNDFDVLEADNGYTAMQIILGKKHRIDGMLLDIYMPVLDGFHVLELMADNGIKDIPIIIITAESTQFNVMKTASYNISDFICKPYDADQILTRLRNMFHVTPGEGKSEKTEKIPLSQKESLEHEVAETNLYISRLESIYKTYLKNFGRKEEHYERVSHVMEILLKEYAPIAKEPELDRQHISMAARAAYFYDIGRMAVPYTKGDEEDQRSKSGIGETHTVLGARLVMLNPMPECQYFTRVCADMCMHHHERFDGEGYPQKLQGDEISFYAQLCAASARFDRLFVKRPELDETQFDFVLHEMTVDTGEFSPEMFFLLRNCQPSLLTYYKYHFNTTNRES